MAGPVLSRTNDCINGMNFENMPELSSRSGYFIVIAVMFVIAVMQLFYFRKKRWL